MKADARYRGEIGFECQSYFRHVVTAALVPARAAQRAREQGRITLMRLG